MKLRFAAGLAAAALLPAAPAAAAPVTVDLRIEGETRTLFEGQVTTDVRQFRFTAETDGHTCDGTSATGGPNSMPVPTRGAAIAEAAERTPFAIEGTWHPQFGATFTRIAGEYVAYDDATSRYLAEFENGRIAQLGACADDIQPGDEVLFAYGTGSERVLALAGPATARPGEAITVRVSDAASGDAVAGADVGGRQTGPDGTAAVGPLTTRGAHDFKATTTSGTIRSNRLRVCVTDGADGACGTTLAPPAADTTAPVGTILGIRDGQRFSRRKAPRELRGTVSADPSGLWAVKIRLTRRLGRTCWYFSGSREQFLRRTCGKKHAFKVGDRTEWRYLLPSRLRRGRYVLDLYAVDNAFNRGTPVRGTSRVVFRVR
jgi:hypothetical protein